MKIEEFIEQWIDGQCRKLSTEIDEYDQIMEFLTNLGYEEGDDGDSS